MKLNAEQARAVDSPASYKLVIAGPGSGKTRTLCAAVADTVTKGTPAEAVVVVTYTNAAADEVETRLKKEFGLAVRLGFVGTLHSFCLSLVREHPEALGLPQVLSVVDDEQRADLLETVRSELGVKVSPKRAMEILEMSHGCDTVIGVAPTKEMLLVKEYHRRLKAAGLLDFDMILKLGHDYIRSEPAGWSFEALFWDEAQDSSDTDFDILMTMPCEKKFIVGDFDQRIFSFRGSSNQFEKLVAQSLTFGS